MSGGARIKRETADRMVPEFMERVAKVNSDDRYLFRFSRVVLFGSYVNSDRPKIGDIDIGFELEPKWSGETFQAICAAKSDFECPSGHDLVFRIFWPKEEALRAAKGGNRYISLHNIGSDFGAVFSDGFVEMPIPETGCGPIPDEMPSCPRCGRRLSFGYSEDPDFDTPVWSVYCPEHVCEEEVSTMSFVDAVRTWAEDHAESPEDERMDEILYAEPKEEPERGGPDCTDCTHCILVEYGEGGMYYACTKGDRLVMIKGQSPEFCGDFVREVSE